MRFIAKTLRAMRKVLISLCTCSAGALVPTFAHACASCGCTLNSDWENLGVSSSSGFKLDIRYDYLNQNQLRSGKNAISSSAASQIANDGDAQEVESYTTNRYLTIGLDYSPNPNWGINVQIPYIDRGHSTLGTASDGNTPGDGGGQYDSSTANIGDVKVIGRYQGFSSQHNFGVMVGLKLPTGNYRESGISTDPTAPGAVSIDPGLQPGTGSTDLILGAYYTDTLNRNWDYYGQVMYQTAISNREGYKPGDGFNLNAGVRYMGFTHFTPVLQLNVRHAARDSGELADTVSTGGTLAYLSPGLVVPIGKQASIYGFVQLPIYQNVNGVQLAPRYTASLGLHYAF